MGEIIRATLRLYRGAFEATILSMARCWIIAVAVVLFGGLMVVATVVAGNLGIIGGFILGDRAPVPPFRDPVASQSLVRPADKVHCGRDQLRIVEASILNYLFQQGQRLRVAAFLHQRCPFPQTGRDTADDSGAG